MLPNGAVSVQYNTQLADNRLEKCMWDTLHRKFRGIRQLSLETDERCHLSPSNTGQAGEATPSLNNHFQQRCLVINLFEASEMASPLSSTLRTSCRHKL